MNFYRDESTNPKWNAQRNLQGRTHYVDDDTLRWHKSRILTTRITDNGLLFALVESCAADMNNTKRGFRAVIFDIFGTVVSRPKLEDLVSSRKIAEKAMWQALNTLDAKQLTLDAIEKSERNYLNEMHELKIKVNKLNEVAA